MHSKSSALNEETLTFDPELHPNELPVNLTTVLTKSGNERPIHMRDVESQNEQFIMNVFSPQLEKNFVVREIETEASQHTSCIKCFSSAKVVQCQVVSGHGYLDVNIHQLLCPHTQTGAMGPGRSHQNGLPRPSKLMGDSDDERLDLTMKLDNLKPRAKTPAFIYILTFFSALGGFLFGYDTGVISGAMILLRNDFRYFVFLAALSTEHNFLI
ncbi:proton myo-inositol cotransporter [Biomphalaria pfeifferi]|uniref:Proton myo-inositol cotransporter n=1 Tax=Biomphalaria pfeifferi TaxID=112525 RepID=A0AAD8BXJ2_BIOPF|nr:proton myo-inositol cotransporter [Biomphalaria pfeifferi]